MTRTDYVQAVYPHPRFPQRWVVDLPWGIRLYTMNALHASLCERAGKVHRAVRLTTKTDGRFGEQITSVELEPAQPQEASHESR
jgi:hypothetical protein